jgi:hypothetical protein
MRRRGKQKEKNEDGDILFRQSGGQTKNISN